MKRVISLLLCLVFVLSGVGASNGETSSSQTEERESGISTSEELTDGAAWETLEGLGKIVTENGVFYVLITLPAEIVGSDITQESIDLDVGEFYTSGKLNEDGSVTYKMTKPQHKAMLDGITESFDEGLQEMVDSPDNTFTSITHNDDFTLFDVYLSTEEVGFAEGFMVYECSSDF